MRCVGKQKIYWTDLFMFDGEDEKKYDDVLSKFDNYFDPRTNLITSVDDFINDCKIQAKTWRLLLECCMRWLRIATSKRKTNG